MGYFKVEFMLSVVIPARRESFLRKDSGQARMTEIWDEKSLTISHILSIILPNAEAAEKVI